jgi:hypothetical protein
MRIVKTRSLKDSVFICLMNGKWWTFWDLKAEIYEKNNRFYDHTSISASLREIRHLPSRQRYGLPLDMNVEVIVRRKRETGDGYEYKLNLTEDEIALIKEKKNARR